MYVNMDDGGSSDDNRNTANIINVVEYKAYLCEFLHRCVFLCFKRILS